VIENATYWSVDDFIGNLVPPSASDAFDALRARHTLNNTIPTITTTNKPSAPPTAPPMIAPFDDCASTSIAVVVVGVVVFAPGSIVSIDNVVDDVIPGTVGSTSVLLAVPPVGWTVRTNGGVDIPGN
jgi:hypothetical protein